MIEVIALQRGHDGTQLREPGEVFDVSESQATDGSTWFRATDLEAAKRLAERTAERAAERARAQADEEAQRAKSEAAAVRERLLAALETQP